MTAGSKIALSSVNNPFGKSYEARTSFDCFPEAVKRSGDELPDGQPILQVDTCPLTIYSAAAIQELNAKVTRELELRDEENAKLKESVTELKELLQSLNQKLNGGAK